MLSLHPEVLSQPIGDPVSLGPEAKNLLFKEQCLCLCHGQLIYKAQTGLKALLMQGTSFFAYQNALGGVPAWTEEKDVYDLCLLLSLCVTALAPSYR